MFIAGHLNDNVLEQYVMGGLTEADSEVVEDHLSLCSHCQDQMDETTAFVRGMRAALEKAPAEEAERRNLLSRVHESWGLAKAGWSFRMWTGVAVAAAGLILTVGIATRPVELGAPLQVRLETTRGTSAVVHGTGPFEFELFMPAAAETYQVELLDDKGRKRWEGNVPGKNGNLQVMVNRKVPLGQYYLHVSEARTGLQHDYAVRVER